MKHPKSEDVLKVIKIFKRAVAFRGNRKVNMLETNLCGTSLCHAGWFAVGYNPLNSLSIKSDYSKGIKLMDKVLGFPIIDEKSNSFYYDIKSWAINNPAIWGNCHGSWIFNDIRAFGIETENEKNASIKDIVKHWEGVYERLVKVEEAELLISKHQ